LRGPAPESGPRFSTSSEMECCLITLPTANRNIAAALRLSRHFPPFCFSAPLPLSPPLCVCRHRCAAASRALNLVDPINQGRRTCRRARRGPCRRECANRPPPAHRTNIIACQLRMTQRVPYHDVIKRQTTVRHLRAPILCTAIASTATSEPECACANDRQIRTGRCQSGKSASVF